MGARHSTPAQQDTAPPGQGNEHWRRVVDAGALPHILRLLKPSIRDVFALARSCRDLWDATAAGPPELWQELYVANDPLLHENAPLRKALLHPSYSDHSERLPFRAAPRLAPQGVWCRCCALLYAKPRLVLVLAGRDPVVVRRLGQSDAAASHVTLGINYHLDSYLDDDENRFAAEFPDLYPLTAGDLVVTQDYRGAGCFTAVPDPEPPAGAPPGRLMLKKNHYDSGGFGILCKAVAPPSFPLFFYCEAAMGDATDRKALLAKPPYWYSYTQLKDKQMFSWDSHELFKDL